MDIAQLWLFPTIIPAQMGNPVNQPTGFVSLKGSSKRNRLQSFLEAELASRLAIS